jgi:transposase
VLRTIKEVNRLKVLQRYMDGTIDIEQAANLLKRRPRSVYRMVKKVREKGPEGVRHGNRNKVSPRRVPEVLRKELTDPAPGKYRDINDTHLCEILRKAEGIVSGREKLRSILRKNLRRSSLGHESQGHSL